jgi:SAM-dependent methyltransferase
LTPSARSGDLIAGDGTKNGLSRSEQKTLSTTQNNHLTGKAPYKSIANLALAVQDFLAMQLPESRFDGIFANASLFHVPSQELQRVLLELFQTLKPRGVLFSSNPRGNNEEGFTDDRYACFFDLDTWRDYVTSAGFEEVEHYYRPPGLPRHKQPWLATVWRKA